MGNDSQKPLRGKGQSRRLEKQHELAGGPSGVFGEEAKKHDLSIRKVMEWLMKALQARHPDLIFRHRMEISKKEISNKLSALDSKLGKVLFVQNASIKPDGGVIEVKDGSGNFRVVLVSESKHQGNDVEKSVPA